MDILNTLALKSNRQIKINFDGGDLSSDAGHHPLLCYDGLTGDLLKAELRDGTLHCSNDADKFMEPLFQEYMERGIRSFSFTVVVAGWKTLSRKAKAGLTLPLSAVITK